METNADECRAPPQRPQIVVVLEDGHFCLTLADQAIDVVVVDHFHSDSGATRLAVPAVNVVKPKGVKKLMAEVE